MAYYITINKNKEEVKLDISSLRQFRRFSKFKNSSYSLEELDRFTSEFVDEVDLKKELYCSGIITFDDILRDISVRMALGGKLKKVSYDLVYSDRRKYLNIDYLRNSLLSLSKDKYFLTKLVSRYRNSYVNDYIITDIRNYIHGNLEINIYYCIEKFFVNELFYTEKEHGEVKLKYKSFHDLAMFICHYIEQKDYDKIGITEKSLNLSKNKRLLQLQSELLQPLENIVVKKKVLKNQIEGQTSLFD